MFARTALSVLAILAAASGLASAEEWPERPVTLVVTFAAGSGDDLLARVLAPRLSQLLGQQVVVENEGGAGGMIGTNRVAKAAPDGYELVLGGTGTFAANQTLYKHPAYNAVTDFEPVALVAEQPMVLVVNNTFPADTLQQFAAYGKAHPGLQFASGGVGSATHLACLLLNSRIGVKATHVPYRSAAIALEDLIGGRLDYVCPIVSTALSQIRGHRVKALAVLSRNRTAALPDVPTAQEQGVADLDASIWDGIFAPKGTPAAVVRKLHDAIVATMNTPGIDDRIKAMGGALVAPDRRSPEYLHQFVESEIKKWAEPIRESGVSIK